MSVNLTMFCLEGLVGFVVVPWCFRKFRSPQQKAAK